MDWGTSFKFTAACMGAFFVWLFGGWDNLLSVLLAFVVIDYLTGVVAAGVAGQLSSSVGLKGIAKKIFIFMLVAVAHMADMAVGMESIIRDACIFFYLANELLSITENAGRIGVPIPDVIRQAIDILADKGRESSKNE